MPTIHVPTLNDDQFPNRHGLYTLKTSGLYSSISLPATNTVFQYYPHFYPPGMGGVRPYEWRSWTVDVPSFE